MPPSLAAIVERSLDKTAGRRFQNGADLARALEALEPGAPVTLPPRPKGWRRSSSVMVVLAALAIGLALASGVRVTRRPSRVEVEVGGRTPPPVPEVPVPPPPAPPALGAPPELPGEITREVTRELRQPRDVDSAGGHDGSRHYLGRLHERDDVARARRHLEKAASEDCDQADFAREELALLQSR